MSNKFRTLQNISEQLCVMGKYMNEVSANTTYSAWQYQTVSLVELVSVTASICQINPSKGGYYFMTEGCRIGQLSEIYIFI